MFDNVGNRIKVLSKVIFWVYLVISIILGIVLIVGGFESDYDSSALSFRGLTLIITGPIVGWIIGLLMYGFGELIEKTSYIERSVRTNNKSDTELQVEYFRIIKLNKLRQKGIISEEEYQNAVRNERI